MEKIIVDRIKPFSFSAKVSDKYGDFNIRRQIDSSLKILEFTIDDLMFFDAPSDEMLRASDFQKMVLEAGYVPLDVYCARAIYENHDTRWSLSFLWSASAIDASGCELDNILFLGSVVSRNDSDVDHFSMFKYKPFSEEVDFLPIEDDPYFIKNRDFFLVFKKSFIEQLGI